MKQLKERNETKPPSAPDSLSSKDEENRSDHRVSWSAVLWKGNAVTDSV